MAWEKGQCSELSTVRMRYRFGSQGVAYPGAFQVVAACQSVEWMIFNITSLVKRLTSQCKFTKNF